MPVGPYFADFACFMGKLIIEVDGGQHAAAAAYDDDRDHFLEGQDYRVLRFWNNDVLNNTDGVLEKIAESLSLGTGKEQRQLQEGQLDSLSSSPSQPSAGPLPLPVGEV